jgi:hypothetical protein
MSSDTHKAIVRRSIEQPLVHGDLAALDVVYTPDYAGHDSSNPDVTDVSGTKAFVGELRASYSEHRRLDRRPNRRRGSGREALDLSRRGHRFRPGWRTNGQSGRNRGHHDFAPPRRANRRRVGAMGRARVGAAARMTAPRIADDADCRERSFGILAGRSSSCPDSRNPAGAGLRSRLTDRSFCVEAPELVLTPFPSHGVVRYDAVTVAPSREIAREESSCAGA